MTDFHFQICPPLYPHVASLVSPISHALLTMNETLTLLGKVGSMLPLLKTSGLVTMTEFMLYDFRSKVMKGNIVFALLSGHVLWNHQAVT